MTKDSLKGNRFSFGFMSFSVHIFPQMSTHGLPERDGEEIRTSQWAIVHLLVQHCSMRRTQFYVLSWELGKQVKIWSWWSCLFHFGIISILYVFNLTVSYGLQNAVQYNIFMESMNLIQHEYWGQRHIYTVLIKTRTLCYI